MLFLLGALIAALLLSALVLFFLWPVKNEVRKRSLQVVVLGDIGRSPRMQYHASSFAGHGGAVNIVGFLENEPLLELKNNPDVSFTILPSSPQVLSTSNKALFLVTAPIKVLLQLLGLWIALTQQPMTYEWMLVQNPPSIPTLLLAMLACRYRGTKLVIDWHNFGYSILALKLGDSHFLIKLAKSYEQYFGRFARANFAVTDAMCRVLRSQFALTAPVVALHDRPAPLFKPLAEAERVAFLTRHELTALYADAILNKHTRLLVSSTSWTADEDFSVLLEALQTYSASATSISPQLPELLVIITGKGPLRDQYLQQIQDLEKKQELEMVTIKTAWLSFGDYASLLGAADLGISLHTSSSGVDLPMKVVDMFGAGLPVLGFSDFEAWTELVRENVNGQGFINAREMSEKLQNLLEPSDQKLGILRKGAMRESQRTWKDEWDSIAARLFGLVP